MVLRVAVIGGGAAGIVAAKSLREKGLSVVVFEKSSSVGGVWKYDADTTADSCTYQSLRTNLPTAVMQFKGFSYPADVPSYPSHVDVLQYITSYAEHFKVDEVICLSSSVTNVYKSKRNDSVWRVCVSSLERGEYEEEVDRLVVCNGHFSEPFCAPLKGIANFKGTIVHSKSYRTPEGYAGKTILIIGRGPSGGEISRELAVNGAANVIVSSQKCQPESGSPKQSANGENQASVDRVEPDGTVVLTDGTRLPPGSIGPTPDRLELSGNDKRVLKPKIDCIGEDGNVHFADGTSIASPDVIMFCTGYAYSVGNFLPAGLLFPGAAIDLTSVGLEPELSTEVATAAAAGLAIAPLYKQVFAIEEPGLAFVGLPFDTATFQCFELQSLWLSSVFSGRTTLPTKEKMYADFCEEIRQTKSPVGKNIHALGLKHFPYFSEVSALSNCALDLVDLALFGDAAFLLFNFDNFRSASYTQDPETKTWTRRITPKDSETELVKTF